MQRGLDSAIEKLLKPLAQHTMNQDLHIVDLGTADGVNGFSVIDRFAKTLSVAKVDSKPRLSVSHVDVPTADFKVLSNNIYNRADSYYSSLSHLYDIQPSIVPGSFYGPYIEPQSADIIFSTTALHYASKSVCSVSQHVDPLYAKGKEKDVWSQLSRVDLDQIMQHVYQGLRPGGIFWAVAPAHTTDTQGNIANHWNREVWNIMIELLNQHYDTASDVDASIWQDFVIPVHQRHISEWEQWFNSNSDKFKLRLLEVVESPNPYLTRYHQHNKPEQFADDYLGFLKAWGEHIIARLIPEKKDQDIFYKKIHTAFKLNPDKFESDNVSTYVGATRI